MVNVNQVSPLLAFPIAEAATLKALQLDDDLSEAHDAAANVRLFRYLDFAGSERELLRALELNPRNTSALTNYAWLLQCTERFDEAMAVRKREIEVDPLSPRIQQGLGSVYLSARQYDRGIEQTILVLGMNPNYLEGHINLVRGYALRHEYDKAIEHARKAVELGRGDYDYGLGFLGYALGMAGRRAEANEVLQTLKSRPEQQHVSPLAFVYLGLGDLDAAFLQMEKALSDRHFVLRLKSEPILYPLRSDPRFTALLRRAGWS
jgi:tetratricopeptide (TPR) repeat protein